MRQALSVTTVTYAFIEHFHRARELPRGRLTFLPNGADTERLQPMPRDAALAQRLGVGDRKVFTFAGTHAPYQGLEVILEAAKLVQHRTDIVFRMVGKGPVRADLMKRAETEGITNVLFRRSPFDEMPRLMSLTWASLVVLRRMNIATKIRLSKAIPPLAFWRAHHLWGWGETAEIVDREHVGLTVEPENAEALAQAVERLADDPDLRHDLGRRGRALAVRDLSWQPVVTIIGLQFGAVLTGTVITETVFAWSGIGRLLIQSIGFRDYPLVQGCILLIAVTYVAVNLLTDLLYGVLDPRIRFE